MTKEWFVKPASPELIQTLVSSLGISPVIARLFINRGYTTIESINTFLNAKLSDLPNPFLMKDMDKAVSRILDAISKGEKIVIYGDYDVDGTVSTSMLWHFFTELNCHVGFYIPHRVREGYSLNVNSLHKLKEDGCGLLITVDNGTSSHVAIGEAVKIGLDIIVTDHHEVPPTMPEALAVVNPQRKDCEYPAKEICGAGVAYNLMMALRSRLRDRGYFKDRPEPNLKKYLDFVALATVADVMPLTGVNRIFVRYGMEQMAHTNWIGLKALIDVAEVKIPIQSEALGFYMGPRLNACGRLYEASTGVRMLISSDMVKAKSLALELNSANLERRQIEKDIVNEAIELYESDPQYAKRAAVVLFSKTWHPGVVGIVASRLMNKYHKPFVVMAPDGEYIKGSARSYGGINITAAIRACGSLIVKCGGHFAASGLSIKSEDKNSFEEKLHEVVLDKTRENPISTELLLDDELDLSLMTLDFYNDLNKLAPFGNGNPEPLFFAKSLTPDDARVVGEKHLKLKFLQGDKPVNYAAIAFGRGADMEKLAPLMDVVFNCQKNTFQGRTSIELKVVDWKKSLNI